MNLWLKRVKFVYALAIAVAISIIHVSDSSAKSNSRQAPNIIEQVIRIFFPRDNRDRASPTGRKKGGATRDRCPNIQPPLIALVPSTPDETPFVEKTIRDRPTFWFYIPFFPTFSREAEFVIIDEDEKDVYNARFPLTQQPGIVRLKLPSTMPPLQEGKRYRWVFSVMCNPANRSGDATVNGWVQRVPLTPALERQLKEKLGLDQVAIYAEAELWQEMLTALAESQQANPQQLQLKSAWKETLGAIGLTNLVADKWKTYLLPRTSVPSRKSLR